MAWRRWFYPVLDPRVLVVRKMLASQAVCLGGPMFEGLVSQNQTWVIGQ